MQLVLEGVKRAVEKTTSVGEMKLAVRMTYVLWGMKYVVMKSFVEM